MISSSAESRSSADFLEFARADFPVGSAGESQARNIEHTNPASAQTAGSPSQHELSPAADVADLSTLDLGRDRVTPTDAAESLDSPNNTNTNPTMSLSIRKSVPPHLSLEQVDTSVPATHRTTAATTTTPTDKIANVHKPLPKSPASAKLGGFFNWVSTPTTSEFSDKGFSPLPSPYSAKRRTDSAASDVTPAPKGLHSGHANEADENPLDYCEDYLQTPPPPTTPPAELEEMEDELKAIGAELASSIRREMDLEDLVDRLQEQVNNPQAPGKRTSDYYSDSGYSSAKFSDYDQAKEEISQVQRRAEQEKAQIRLELTNKLQDERSRRRVLDQQITELSKRASRIDLSQVNNKDTTGRVKELEDSCEDLRRRLAEERQVKENFEDLLSALKGELRSATNERDNLRDEIVPQLRARVEGLEAQAAEQAKTVYDTTKMQQELQSLKDENSELKQTTPRMSMGLSRSASVAGTSPAFPRSRPTSLARSNTSKQVESRETLAERLKDVESQRDALHSALKNLLERQELQTRDYQKRIKTLEVERERLMSASPKKAGYEKEVSNLRNEISVLRRRAEEAIEQKWQVEKGLGGLKMDIDRAEGEIASLRGLLKEQDILIPESLARSSGGSSSSSAAPVTSASLNKAYQDLQAAYKDALDRIKLLESNTPSDEKTRLAIQRLERSLSTAVSERDIAKQEADSYRTQLDSYQSSEKQHLASEKDLADQLHASARRVEELAQQVSNQLAANASLRTRLSETVSRGESEQLANKERISTIQSRLRTLEEQLIAAQTANEERINAHEDEIATLKESHNTQLQRLRDASGGLRSPRLFPVKSSPSPLLSPGLKSPRFLTSPTRPSIRRTSTAPSEADADGAEVETLKTRVKELEMALAAADADMQDVVGRMSAAQIEVLQLQEEREEAVRQTRRLQRQLEQEKVASFEEKFKTLSS